MTRLTKCLMTGAAVLLTTAGTASAQSLMKAEIPFAFSIGDKVVEPGTYKVRTIPSHSSHVVLGMFNADTRHGNLLLPKTSDDPSPKWIASGQPRLAFDCTTGTCILAKVWFGEGRAYEFYRPRMRGGEMLLTEVVMKPDKAE